MTNIKLIIFLTVWAIAATITCVVLYMDKNYLGESYSEKLDQIQSDYEFEFSSLKKQSEEQEERNRIAVENAEKAVEKANEAQNRLSEALNEASHSKAKVAQLTAKLAGISEVKQTETGIELETKDAFEIVRKCMECENNLDLCKKECTLVTATLIQEKDKRISQCQMKNLDSEKAVKEITLSRDAWESKAKLAASDKWDYFGYGTGTGAVLMGVVLIALYFGVAH